METKFYRLSEHIGFKNCLIYFFKFFLLSLCSLSHFYLFRLEKLDVKRSLLKMYGQQVTRPLPSRQITSLTCTGKKYTFLFQCFTCLLWIMQVQSSVAFQLSCCCGSDSAGWIYTIFPFPRQPIDKFIESDHLMLPSNLRPSSYFCPRVVNASLNRWRGRCIFWRRRSLTRTLDASKIMNLF